MTYLLDTNILVYALDGGSPVKQSRAQALLRQLGYTDSAALSTQTLAEFANVTLRRLQPPISADQVLKVVGQYELSFKILPVSARVVMEAIRGVRDYQLSYYDAQIWAVARLHQVPYILSEDFNSGGTLEGVSFVNPFTSELQL